MPVTLNIEVFKANVKTDEKDNFYFHLVLYLTTKVFLYVKYMPFI